MEASSSSAKSYLMPGQAKLAIRTQKTFICIPQAKGAAGSVANTHVESASTAPQHLKIT